MLGSRVVNRLVLLSIPVALLVYFSRQPVMRLKPEMPSTFADVPVQASFSQQAAEERIAQGYWKCASTLIQWQYTYGSPLPDKPPVDFQLDPSEAAASNVRPDSRRRYWRRLQQFWNSPDNWVTSYKWSTNWATDLLNHGVEGIREYFRRIKAS